MRRCTGQTMAGAFRTSLSLPAPKSLFGLPRVVRRPYCGTMKCLCVLTVALASLYLQGCASNEPARPGTQQARREESGFDRTTPPRLGMSRQEVRRLYGEPKYVSQSPRGEIWNYTFDAWKFQIPYYNLAAKSKTGTVIFDASGRVQDYHWGQSRSAFMMGM
jgi:outer membrane protein assembly factor BamE (lipoprotein component of BamABCDE complex)